MHGESTVARSELPEEVLVLVHKIWRAGGRAGFVHVGVEGNELVDKVAKGTLG